MNKTPGSFHAVLNREKARCVAARQGDHRAHAMPRTHQICPTWGLLVRPAERLGRAPRGAFLSAVISFNMKITSYQRIHADPDTTEPRVCSRHQHARIFDMPASARRFCLCRYRKHTLMQHRARLLSLGRLMTGWALTGFKQGARRHGRARARTPRRRPFRRTQTRFRE